jgi:predicted transcriptional regulator
MSINSQANRDAVYFDLAMEDCSRAQRSILKALENGGLTRHEIAEVCNMPLSTVCGRISELEEKGLVRTSADKRTTQYGKPATVVVSNIPKLRQGMFAFVD